MVSEQQVLAPNGAGRGQSAGNVRRTLTRDYRRLIKECTEKLLSNPLHVLAMRLRAQSYRMLGEDEAALADYNSLLALEPTDVDALFYRGTILERQQLIDEAIKCYTAVLEQEPQHHKALYNRAVCYSAKGSFAQAIEDYNAALELDQQASKCGARRSQLQQQVAASLGAAADAAATALLHAPTPASNGQGAPANTAATGGPLSNQPHRLLPGALDGHALSNNTSVSDVSAGGWDRRQSTTSFWSATPQSTASDAPGSLADDDVGPGESALVSTGSGAMTGAAAPGAGMYSNVAGPDPTQQQPKHPNRNVQAKRQPHQQQPGEGVGVDGGLADRGRQDMAPHSQGALPYTLEHEPPAGPFGRPQMQPDRDDTYPQAGDLSRFQRGLGGVADAMAAEQRQMTEDEYVLEQLRNLFAESVRQERNDGLASGRRGGEAECEGGAWELEGEDGGEASGEGDSGRHHESGPVWDGDGQHHLVHKWLGSGAGSGSITQHADQPLIFGKPSSTAGKPDTGAREAPQEPRRARPASGPGLGAVRSSNSANPKGSLGSPRSHPAARNGSSSARESGAFVGVVHGAGPGPDADAFNGDSFQRRQQMLRPQQQQQPHLSRPQGSGRTPPPHPFPLQAQQRQAQPQPQGASGGRNGSTRPAGPAGRAATLPGSGGRELRSPSPFERIFTAVPQQQPSEDPRAGASGSGRSVSRGAVRKGTARQHEPQPSALLDGRAAGRVPLQQQQQQQPPPPLQLSTPPLQLQHLMMQSSGPGGAGGPDFGGAAPPGDTHHMVASQLYMSHSAQQGGLAGFVPGFGTGSGLPTHRSAREDESPASGVAGSATRASMAADGGYAAMRNGQVQQSQQQQGPHYQEQPPQQQQLRQQDLRGSSFRASGGAGSARDAHQPATGSARGTFASSSADEHMRYTAAERDTPDGRTAANGAGSGSGTGDGSGVGHGGDGGAGAGSLDPWVSGGPGGMAAAVEMSRPSTSSSAASDHLADQSTRHKAIEQLNSRAFSLRQHGKLLEAVREYSRALELDPGHFKTLFNRGFTYDRLGELAAAVEDYSRALAQDPQSSYAHYNRGITRDRLQDFSGAVEDFTAAIRLEPTNADFYHNRGFALRKQGMFDAAIQDYSAAIMLNPSHCRAYYNRAFCHDRLDHVAEAIEDYSRALDMEPHNATALHNRGSLYERSGRHDLALQDFSRAISADPSCAQSYNARGLLLQSRGRLAEAVADLDAAVALMQPPSAALFRNRAQARRETGDHHGAVQDLSRAISLDPHDLLSYSRRAHCFRRMGEYESAVRDYTRAISLSPNNPKLHTIRAYCYAMMGWYGEAVADYDVVLTLEPGNGHASYNRSIALEKLGGAIDKAAAELSAAAAAAATAAAKGPGGGALPTAGSADRSRSGPPPQLPPHANVAAAAGAPVAPLHARSQSYSTPTEVPALAGAAAATTAMTTQVPYDFVVASGGGGGDDSSSAAGSAHALHHPLSAPGGTSRPGGREAAAQPRSAWAPAPGAAGFGPSSGGNGISHQQPLHQQTGVTAAAAGMRGPSPLRSSTVGVTGSGSAPVGVTGSGSARANGTWAAGHHPRGAVASMAPGGGSGGGGGAVYLRQSFQPQSYQQQGMPWQAGPVGSATGRS